MNNILVTGASGQIGKILVKKFNKNKIVGLDIIQSEKANFPFIEIDLKNGKKLKRWKKILEEVNILIHLASTVNSSQDVIKDGVNSIDLNIHATLNLLQNLPNLKQISFASSYMVYGTPKKNPVWESHFTNPENTYAASKLLTEKILRVYSEKMKINFTILRFMGIYGIVSPYIKQAIPSFIEKIMKNENPVIFGSGKVKRNHIYIDDAIDAIITSIKNKKNGEYNIGGFDSPTNLEIIKIINKSLDMKIKPNFKNSENKEHSFIANIEKARSILQFNPKISIEQGIDKTIQKYNDRGYGQKF